MYSEGQQKEILIQTQREQLNAYLIYDNQMYLEHIDKPLQKELNNSYINKLEYIIFLNIISEKKSVIENFIGY
jgi:hypothetical protein